MTDQPYVRPIAHVVTETLRTTKIRLGDPLDIGELAETLAARITAVVASELWDPKPTLTETSWGVQAQTESGEWRYLSAGYANHSDALDRRDLAQDNRPELTTRIVRVTTLVTETDR